MAGMTIKVSKVDDIMPPIIGTAIRCITSAPVPWLHMIGNRPAMMAATVIIFGRTRSTFPSASFVCQRDLIRELAETGGDIEIAEKTLCALLGGLRALERHCDLILTWVKG